MSQDVLDLSVLSEMFGDDQQLIASVLGEFKRNAQPYSDELQQALSIKDAQGVRALSHKLKSSSRTIGALALARLCESLERAAVISEWLYVVQLSAELNDALEAVVVEIDKTVD